MNLSPVVRIHTPDASPAATSARPLAGIYPTFTGHGDPTGVVTGNPAGGDTYEDLDTGAIYQQGGFVPADTGWGFQATANTNGRIELTSKDNADVAIQTFGIGPMAITQHGSGGIAIEDLGGSGGGDLLLLSTGVVTLAGTVGVQIQGGGPGAAAPVRIFTEPGFGSPASPVILNPGINHPTQADVWLEPSTNQGTGFSDTITLNALYEGSELRSLLAVQGSHQGLIAGATQLNIAADQVRIDTSASGISGAPGGLLVTDTTPFGSGGFEMTTHSNILLQANNTTTAISMDNISLSLSYAAAGGGSTSLVLATNFAQLQVGTSGTLYITSLFEMVIGGDGFTACDIAIGKPIDSIGFFTGSGGVTKRTVTGSRGGNVALTSLLTALAQYGLIVNSST